MLALVTGASSGIGRELALGFAGRGFDLVLLARDEARLQATAAEAGRRYAVKTTVIPADLSDPAAPAFLAETCRARGLDVDVLVNNAGFGTLGPLAAVDTMSDMDQIRVNVAAPTHLVKLFLPAMVARKRGGILNVASTAGFQPGPYMAVYYAGKAYLISLTEALAEELRGTGVTASVLCPGPTRTEFQSRAGMAQTGVAIAREQLLMDAAPVAAAGIRGFLRGTTVIVPGIPNRIGAAAVRLVPRGLTRRIVARLNIPRMASRT